MSDSQSKFAAAVAARKAEAAEEAARKANGGSFNYVELPWSALAPNVEKVVRLRGGPCIEGRAPTDAKRIYTTMILGDDDKKFRVLAPNPRERKDWILHKITSLVLSYDWDPDTVNPATGRKGVKIYNYAASNPDIFNRVFKNNNVDNPYESGWYFPETIVWNVIDRAAIDWHKDTKKCRLLSKKAGEPDKNGKVWFDYGVPTTVYNLIVDDILSTDGNTDWNDYDIVIKKLSQDPWYKVYHGIDDAKRISDDAKKLVVSGALTAEELSWEMWDLDKYFQITSYKRIKDHLGIFIQQVDKVFGKHYYEELCEEVEKEEAEKAKQKAENAPATAVSERPTLSEAPTPAATEEKIYAPDSEDKLDPYSQPVATPAPAAPTVAETPKEAAAPTRPTFAPATSTNSNKVLNPLSKMTPEKWQGLMDGTLTGRVYEGVKLMTEEEKALVLDIDMETGKFIWDERAGDLYEGASSGFPSPACVHVDPFDATIFPSSSVCPIPELN